MWIISSILLALCLSGETFGSDVKTYNGYSIHRVTITERNEDLVSQMIQDEGYTVVNNYSPQKGVLDLLVAPNARSRFEKNIKRNMIERKVLVQDVEGLRRRGSNYRRSSSGRFDVSAYHSYAEIMDYLATLLNVTNPYTKKPIMAVEEIGKSFEGRGVYMAKISSDHSMKKPIILMDAAMHAREWAAPPTVLYTMKQLVENFTHNLDMLRYFDYYIIPLANPDGFEYSRTKDIMWRKTRTVRNDICIGVDGNRNFDFEWGGPGTSSFPCSDTYKGPYPFSEKESRNIRDVGYKYRNRIVAYMAIHSYGPFVLYPWGNSKVLLSDEDMINDCGQSFAKVIRKNSGTDYTVGSSSRVLYEAAGGSDDWFKGALGVPFAYTIELPGETFHVEESFLKGIGEDAFLGFKAMAKCFLKYVGRMSW